VSRLSILLLAIATCWLSGCGFFKNDQLGQLQTEKQQLVERISLEMQQKQTLENENKQLNDRLAQAEKDLALLSDNSGMSANLESLARVNPSLNYDPTSKAARLESAITFPSASSELTPAAKQSLDNLAAAMKSPGAAGANVLLSSWGGDESDDSQIELSAARVRVVAMYLRQRGVPSDRMTTVAIGSDNGLSTAKVARVELFMLEPDSPLLTSLPTGLRQY